VDPCRCPHNILIPGLAIPFIEEDHKAEEDARSKRSIAGMTEITREGGERRKIGKTR
jgi:hypothetical protein